MGLDSQLVIGTTYLPMRTDVTVKLIKIYMVPSLTSSIILGIDFCRLFEIRLDLLLKPILGQIIEVVFIFQ